MLARDDKNCLLRGGRREWLASFVLLLACCSEAVRAESTGNGGIRLGLCFCTNGEPCFCAGQKGCCPAGGYLDAATEICQGLVWFFQLEPELSAFFIGGSHVYRVKVSRIDSLGVRLYSFVPLIVRGGLIALFHQLRRVFMDKHLWIQKGLGPDWRHRCQGQQSEEQCRQYSHERGVHRVDRSVEAGRGLLSGA